MVRSRIAFRWPDSHGPYSLRLSRMLMVVVSLAVFATDALSVFVGASSLVMAPHMWLLPIAGLLVFPLVGSVAAGIALSSKKESCTKTRNLDRTWRAAGILMLLDYLGLLIAGCFTALDVLTPMGDLISHQSLLLSYSMAATVAASALLPEVARFSYVVLLYPLSVGNAVHDTGRFDIDAIAAPIFLVTFNVLLTCAITWMSRGAGGLDRATAELTWRELDMAREQALQIGRRRADSYIHDNVLSALTPATTGLANDSYLRRAAKNALASLETAPSARGPLTVGELFAAIAAEVRIWSESVEARVILDPTLSARLVPPEVANAVVGACQEAVVNSLRHARRNDGLPVTRHVEMRGDADGLNIRIADTGNVAPPAKSGLAGHGIKASIIERMRDVGGTAEVHLCANGGGTGVVGTQRRGTGTMVALTWSYPGSTLMASSPMGSLVDESMNSLDHPVIANAAQSRAAQAIGIWAVIAHVIIVAAQASEYTSVAGPILALLWQATAAFFLLRQYSEAVLPLWVRWFVVGAVGLGNLLVLSSLVPVSVSGSYPEYAAWSLGTGWMLCVGLLIRCGPVVSWGSMLFLGATTGLWVGTSGYPWMLALSMMAGQIVSLTFYTLVVRWYRVTMRSLAGTERAARDLELGRLAAKEAGRHLDERLLSVALASRPLLQELAEKGHLSPRQIQEASIVEAQLRDEIRAPGLCTEAIVAAANAARGRGIQVVLLDDRTGPSLPAAALREIESAAALVLERTASGRVVIRLLPAGREHVATIVGPDDRWSLSESGFRPILDA